MFEDDADLTIDLQAAFEERLHLLRVACDAYDRGDLAQAKIIAERVCCICYDGRHDSKSLLGRLSIKDTLMFYTYKSQWRCDDLAALPLATIQCPAGSDEALWRPRVGSVEGLTRLEFDEWWDEVIFETAGVLSLSRKQLVRSMRDMDGSHIDNNLSKNRSYAHIRAKGNRHTTYAVHEKGLTLFVQRFSKEWRVDVLRELSSNLEKPVDCTGLKKIPIPHCHRAMMRTIGGELDRSIAAGLEVGLPVA